MSDTKDFCEGVAILSKYGEDKMYMAAEHDEIWVGGPHPDKVSDDDRADLETLGFSWDTYVDSWHVFT